MHLASISDKLRVDMNEFAYDSVEILSHYLKVNIERCVRFLVYHGILEVNLWWAGFTAKQTLC